MRNSIVTGVSFEPDVYEQLEKERGLIPRSIIVNRALRFALENMPDLCGRKNGRG